MCGKPYLVDCPAELVPWKLDLVHEKLVVHWRLELVLEQFGFADQPVELVHWHLDLAHG